MLLRRWLARGALAPDALTDETYAALDLGAICPVCGGNGWIVPGEPSGGNESCSACDALGRVSLSHVEAFVDEEVDDSPPKEKSSDDLWAELKEAKQLVVLAEKIALDAHEKKEAAEAAAIKAESELQEARETMKMKKAAFDIAFGDG